MIDLTNCSGFEWDKGNSDKNWIRHRVTQAECEEVFFNLPLLLADDDPHSRNEARFYVLGQTSNRRRLFIAFTIRENLVRVISARDMSRRERRVYDSAE